MNIKKKKIIVKDTNSFEKYTILFSYVEFQL